MKRHFTSLLALLLLLSTVFCMTSCLGPKIDANRTPDNGDGNENDDAPITGSTYDGSYFTTLIPDGMTKIYEDNGAAMYMNLTEGKTLFIQEHQQKAEVDENGTVDYSQFEDQFSEEALKEAFSAKENSGIIEHSYSVVHENRLYRLDLTSTASYSPSTKLYSTVYIVFSMPDEENNITVTTLILSGDNEAHSMGDAILPAWK